MSCIGADRSTDRGYTLVEVLLATGLSLLVMGGIMSIYISGSNAFSKLASHADIQYTARSSMQQMAHDIRRASGVEVQENGTKLSLHISDYRVKYYLDNNQLYRSTIKSSGNSTVPIAENVSRLGFEAHSTLISINMAVTIDDLTMSFSGTFFPRLR